MTTTGQSTGPTSATRTGGREAVPPAATSPDLADFIAARIGGEARTPYDQDDGVMLTRTAVQSMAVLGALLDSPATTPEQVRPLTRLLRGAVLTLAMLVGTLSAGGARRGVGLLLLSVGGALLAIDLLTGGTPAWLTTAGFGILLGGIAYAALMSRMYVHALVLVTPAVPLVVWALTWPEEPASAGERGGQMLVVTGLVLVLVATGSVRRHLEPPQVVLAGHLRGGLAVVLRWWWLLLVLAGVVVAGLLVRAWLHVVVDGALDRFALGLALAALVSIATVVAAGRLSGPTTRQTPGPRSPHTVAAAWAWTYATGYAVAAVALAGLTPFGGDDSTLGDLSLPQAPSWLGGADASRWTDPLTMTFAALALGCYAIAIALPLAAWLRDRSA